MFFVKYFFCHRSHGAKYFGTGTLKESLKQRHLPGRRVMRCLQNKMRHCALLSLRFNQLAARHPLAEKLHIEISLGKRGIGDR